MKIQTQTPVITPAPARPAPAPESPAPKDSFLTTTTRETIKTVRSTGDAVGRVTGGAAGLAGAVTGAYLGSLGGAATMGVLGLGAGIPGAILAGDHGLSIVTGAFSAAGSLARGGIVLASVCGTVGGYYVGEKLGYAAGFTSTAAVTLPVAVVGGAAKALSGNVSAPLPPAPPAGPERPHGKFENTVASLVSGVGTLSGAAGGAAIGGLIASGAKLTTSLISRDVALQAIAHSGMMGAAVGAGVGAVLLGVGGYKLVSVSGDVSYAAARKLARGKEQVELNMRSQELDKRLAGLNTAQTDLQTRQTQADQYFAVGEQAWKQATAGADQRLAQAKTDIAQADQAEDQKVAKRNQELDQVLAGVADKTQRQEQLAQERGQGLLEGLKAKDQGQYDTRKAQLASWDQDMIHRQGEWERKEKDADQIVDQESTRRTEHDQAQLESQYQTRRGSLDQREASLNQRQHQLEARQADLPNLIRQEGDRHIADRTRELEQGLAQVKSQLTQNLNNTAQGLTQERGREQDRLNGLERDRRNEYQGVEATQQAEVSRLEGRVSSLQQDVNRKQSDLESTRSQTQQLNNQAQQVLSSIEGDRSRLEQEASSARNEASNLRSQISGARSEASSARSEAEQARSAYQQAAGEYNSLKAEIDQLNNEIANHH